MLERLKPYTHACVRMYAVRNKAPYWIIANGKSTQLVGEFPPGMNPVEGIARRPTIVLAFSWPTKARSSLTTRKPTIAALLPSLKSYHIASKAKSREIGLEVIDNTLRRGDTDSSSSGQTLSRECCHAGMSHLLFYISFFFWALM